MLDRSFLEQNHTECARTNEGNPNDDRNRIQQKRRCPTSFPSERTSCPSNSNRVCQEKTLRALGDEVRARAGSNRKKLRRPRYQKSSQLRHHHQAAAEY